MKYLGKHETRKEHESKFATENYTEYEFVENSIPPRLGLQFMFIVASPRTQNYNLHSKNVF